jgi:surface antigen
VRSFTLSGLPCREYSQTVVIDNMPVRANGTLCRQPDGTWQLR